MSSQRRTALAAGGVPAQQGAHAGGQLAEGEGLDQVVVGAVVEPDDAVLDAVPRRQHEDAGRRLGRAVARAGRRDDVTADVKPVGVGQVQVQADHVVGVHAEPVERGPAVAGDVDGVALASQAGRHRAGEIVFVLDHEDPHAALPVAGAILPTSASTSGRRARFPPGSPCSDRVQPIRPMGSVSHSFSVGMTWSTKQAMLRSASS